MRSNPLPQEFYKHFKGNMYQIKCIAKHSETGEKMVVYQALYGTYDIYVRPLAMFMEEVDHVKYPDVEQKYRFEKVDMSEASNETTVAETSEKVDTVNTTVTEEKEQIAQEEPLEQTAEAPLDPKILEFLDARTYEEKLTILSSVHHRLTDDMIDIMSTATDIDVKPGNIEDRYEEFKNCLLTLQHFECDRLH